jgi:imidazolonepropionase
VPDLALVNAGELVTCRGEGSSLGIVRDGALLVEDGRVVWVGGTKELSQKSVGKPKVLVDAEGGLVTPGFVDAHSHLAFAGTREDELERKVRGESYISILEHGGGIAKTIRDTRKASEGTIAEESAKRVRQLVGNGVTTVEVKTGYGQRLKDEVKMIRAIGRLPRLTGVEVVSTFLGLHATPPEFRRAQDYADFAVKEMLPAVARLRGRPVFSDCFCEEGVFSGKDCERYLEASKKLGFLCKVHADEFSESGGASLAARVGCVSADHLVRSREDGVEGMAREGVSAVLLPGTSLFSGIPYADYRSIEKAGCRVALGTDLSPNSWIESPQLVMSLACNGLRMTPGQALLGFTREAARALNRDDVGRLVVGAKADFVVHSHRSHAFLPYRVGGGYVRSVFKQGKEIFNRGISGDLSGKDSS